MSLKVIFGAAALCAFATAPVHAATVTKWIKLGGTSGSDTSYSFTDGDLTVSVTARTHNAGVLDQTGKVTRNKRRLGATAEGDTSDLVDGSGANDILVFSFNQDVTVKRVLFSKFNNKDSFSMLKYDDDVLASTMNDLSMYGKVSKKAKRKGFGVSKLDREDRLTGDVIGIGANSEDDEFGIRKIRISYEVPDENSGESGASGGAPENEEPKPEEEVVQNNPPKTPEPPKKEEPKKDEPVVVQQEEKKDEPVLTFFDGPKDPQYPMDPQVQDPVIDPPSQVPLPAAGWLMLAGFGGLGLMRRRQKS